MGPGVLVDVSHGLCRHPWYSRTSQRARWGRTLHSAGHWTKQALYTLPNARLRRFFVALAAIAQQVLSFSHGPSLSGCLGVKPPFPAGLATCGSQSLKLVSEALLHVPLNPRLQMQRSGQIEGAQIAVSIPRIFLCSELCCSLSALTVCREAWYIRRAG